MRCLLLSPFVPFPPEDGGRIRIYEILKGLSARHTVDLLALADDASESQAAVDQLRAEGLDVCTVAYRRQPMPVTFLRALGKRSSLYGTLFASRAFATTLRDRLRARDYDIVQCEFPYTALYAPPRTAAARVHWVLDAHNVEFRLNETLLRTTPGLEGAMYRLYARRELSRRRSEELAACLRVNRVVAVSADDRNVLLRALPNLKIDVVPNGVDLGRFRPSDRPEAEREPSAVFVGKMDYRPNVDAVRWFCTEVLPLVREAVPGFTFTICGAQPHRTVLDLGRLQGVSVTGRVPDTRPFVDGAAVVAAPIRAGSGTRLKILEALAMGRPVVTTPLGVEGLELDDGVHVLIANEARDFADCVVRLLRDPSEREKLSREGRQRVEQRYGWPVAIAKLESVYAALLAEGDIGAAR
ncbi:MAG: glycosyltransferase [Gaiellaceae bacterium]